MVQKDKWSMDEWSWLRLLNIPSGDTAIILGRLLAYAEELGLDLEKIQEIVEAKYKPSKEAKNV